MKIPNELERAFSSGNVGLYIGAGISQAAGLPNWEGLINELIEKVKENQFEQNESYIKNLQSLSKDASKYLVLAEELKDNLRDDFKKYISNRFDTNSPKPTDIHRKIISLPASFIITTNYDTLLEDAYVNVFNSQAKVRTFNDGADIAYDLWSGNKFILKAHGDASSVQQGIILTEKDYREIIFNKPGYHSILQTLFSTKTILFLGSSLIDPELNLLLSFIHHSFHGGGPKHFALMNKESMNAIEAENWRKNFKIQILPYDPVENHKEVEDFIDLLKEKIK